METKQEIVPPRISIADVHCPVRQALDLITDKWTPLVIYLLRPGPLRYTQLKRQIGGITQKMLTQTLRKLEHEGLATRTVYPTSPPTVEYALTPLGESLSQPIEELFRWAWTRGIEMRTVREQRAQAEEPTSAQEPQVPVSK
ncbi:transcriptional regulator [Ktedonosporobacter rubrisoli]|uniref:Transcriptional regulator n=1 Tax=Ktedonosporobacter rubrisoli TaxID=2509675 RepID=A0A4P6JL56_KTERU|nr:helix-turn-helix domain-containing protein [Ktedonosporobacter rubrisoli]QBD75928.1 transcriptional regulator [Ktedonosporobacter rubrisoli]